MKLTNSQVIAECRKEAKKHGMTFKSIGNSKYSYFVRKTNNPVRENITLGLAYNIACSGELEIYK